LNIVLASANHDAGTVVVDDVETVNISGAGGAAGTDNGIDIEGDAIETITVDANVAILDDDDEIIGYEMIKFDSLEDLTTLTLIDASASSGAVVVGATNANMTVIGGAGADLIITNADGVTLQGGASDDAFWINGSNLASVSGGEGADFFGIWDATTDVNTSTEITDLEAGDIIKFFEGDTGFVSSGENFINAQVVLDEDGNPDLQNYADAAMEASEDNDISWLQFNDNTYIVVNVDGNDTFTNGVDQIVKISGSVDLSEASFNTTYNMLEIA